MNILIDVLKPLPPKNIIDDVKKLQFRFIRLGILSLDMKYFSNNASIYFPEKKFPFTRIYEPKNRSKMMAPKDKTCIVVEVPCEANDSIYNCNNDEFLCLIKFSLINNGLINKKNIINSTSIKIPYAYPLLDKNSKNILEKVQNFVKSFDNLCLIGRSAEFKYLHTHDLLFQAKCKISQLFN